MAGPVSYLDAWMLIRHRLEGAWLNRTLIGWPNEDNGTPPDASTPWIRVSVKEDDDSEVASVGDNAIYRQSASLVIEVFTVVGEGLGSAYELSGVIADAFRAWSVGSLVFWAPKIVEVGERGGWYKTNVLCPFQWDAHYEHQMTGG